MAYPKLRSVRRLTPIRSRRQPQTLLKSDRAELERLIVQLAIRRIRRKEA